MPIGIKSLVSLLIVSNVADFVHGGVSFRECLTRAEKIPLPNPYKLLTIQQFRDFVADRTQYGFYGGISVVASRLTLFNSEYTWSFNADETVLSFTAKGNAMDGTCVYENNTNYFCSNTLPFPSPDEYNFNGRQVTLSGKRMITNSGDYVAAFFSSEPEQYVWGYVCVCAGAMQPLRTGACPTSNTILILTTPATPPNNINLEKAARDIRELTCINMEGLPGIYDFKFVQGENTCPDRRET